LGKNTGKGFSSWFAHFGIVNGSINDGLGEADWTSTNKKGDDRSSSKITASALNRSSTITTTMLYNSNHRRSAEQKLFAIWRALKPSPQGNFYSIPCIQV
jgi:hypothetical protein